MERCDDEIGTMNGGIRECLELSWVLNDTMWGTISIWWVFSLSDWYRRCNWERAVPLWKNEIYELNNCIRSHGFSFETLYNIKCWMCNRYFQATLIGQIVIDTDNLADFAVWQWKISLPVFSPLEQPYSVCCALILYYEARLSFWSFLYVLVLLCSILVSTRK